MNSIENNAEKLVLYINSLTNFEIITPRTPFNHMGATITSAILQAGVDYDNVVKPRVDNLLENYPEANTTSGFLNALKLFGPESLLDFRGQKIKTIIMIIYLFIMEGIETEEDLKRWIENPEKGLTLLAVKGVGRKTFDYIKNLVGISEVAVDRHLIRFLNNAGINIDLSRYDEAKEIIKNAARKMEIEERTLDHSIWKYMSGGPVNNGCKERPVNLNKQRGYHLHTWAGRSSFSYSGSIETGTTIHYGSGFSHFISSQQYSALLKRFSGTTTEIGTSRDNPPRGSVGDWLQRNVTKTAMASYVGPILIREGYAQKIGKTQIRFSTFVGDQWEKFTPEKKDSTKPKKIKNKEGNIKFGGKGFPIFEGYVHWIDKILAVIAFVWFTIILRWRNVKRTHNFLLILIILFIVTLVVLIIKGFTKES